MDPRVCCFLCLQAHRDSGVSKPQKQEGSADCAPLSAEKARTDSERKRIMVLMSDTGGGHRASAEALKAGFDTLYGDKYKVHKPPSRIHRTASSAVTIAVPCSATSAVHQEPAARLGYSIASQSTALPALSSTIAFRTQNVGGLRASQAVERSPACLGQSTGMCQQHWLLKG